MAQKVEHSLISAARAAGIERRGWIFYNYGLTSEDFRFTVYPLNHC